MGQSAQEIYEDLNMNFNLAKSGAGNVVINQSPKAGARVERGSTIRIYMGSEGDAEEEHADHEHD
ncbi:Stage V sporulation protein D [compost metagenome]